MKDFKRIAIVHTDKEKYSGVKVYYKFTDTLAYYAVPITGIISTDIKNRYNHIFDEIFNEGERYIVICISLDSTRTSRNARCKQLLYDLGMEKEYDVLTSF